MMEANQEWNVVDAMRAQLNNSSMSDVIFLVGPEEDKIFAHRLFLNFGKYSNLIEFKVAFYNLYFSQLNCKL